MPKKKKTKAPTIARASQSYSKIMGTETRKKFNERFIKKLQSGLTSNFGSNRANNALKLLANGTLSIVSPETYFFYGGNIQDPAIKIYQESSSIEEFIFKYLIALKNLINEGCTDITICDLLFVLSDYCSSQSLSERKSLVSHTYMKSIIHQLINFMCSIKDPSAFTVRLVDSKIKSSLYKTGLNLKAYGTIVQQFFEELEHIAKWIGNKTFKLPHFEMCYGIYNDERLSIIDCISSRLRVREETVASALKNIADLSKDSIELRTAVEALASVNKSYNTFDYPALLVEIKRVCNVPRMKVFDGDRSLTETFRNYGLQRRTVKRFKITPVFVNLELFVENQRPCFCEVVVKCTVPQSYTTPLHRIEGWIDYARDLCLMRKYALRSVTSAELPTCPLFKITLTNVKAVSQEFVNLVKNKVKQLESMTNHDFAIDIQYNETFVTKKMDFESTSHFRVISDLHVDLNQDEGYVFNFGDDFVLNCGDTAGNGRLAGIWLKEHLKHGVTVVGNHLGYSHSYPEKDGIENIKKWGTTTHIDNTKNGQIFKMAHDLAPSSVRLLSNSDTEFKGVRILGTCLYSDFTLFGEEHREECMMYAQKMMNDFRYPEVSDHCDYYYLGDGKWTNKIRNKIGRGKIKPFTPHEHAFFFFYSFNYLKEKVKEFYNKPIVIVTHFAPSPHSIAPQYEGDLLNAAFTSDLNEFIINNPNIRLWCHGHTHVPFDYILGETRVVCSPFGYYNENNYDLPFNYGTRIAIDDVKSMTSWKKLCKKEIKDGLIKVYED